MERLTNTSRDSRNSNAVRLFCDNNTALQKLYDYENTGLEPSEVEELKAGVASQEYGAYKLIKNEIKGCLDRERAKDKQIALLSKALDRAVMLSGGKVTREGLLGVAKQELKAEGDNEV